VYSNLYQIALRGKFSAYHMVHGDRSGEDTQRKQIAKGADNERVWCRKIKQDCERVLTGILWVR